VYLEKIGVNFPLKDGYISSWVTTQAPKDKLIFAPVNIIDRCSTIFWDAKVDGLNLKMIMYKKMEFIIDKFGDIKVLEFKNEKT
jgi:hypothetical protein